MSIAVCLLSPMLETRAFADDMPTAQELCDGFRQNFVAFRRPHITWSYTSIRPDSWFQLNKGEIEKLQELVSSKSLDPETAKDIAKNLKGLKARNDLSNSTTIWFDYWTDRKNCHFRMWDGAKPAPRDPSVFPDLKIPLTCDNLENLFKDVVIVSYIPDAVPSCRIWGGINGTAKKGGMHNETPPQVVATFLFPPLGASDTQWGAERFSVIDEFFSHSPGDLLVAGTETVNGAKCYLLDLVRWTPMSEAFRKHGNYEVAQTTRAWIDPRRGFLPLRIEWYTQICRDRVPDKPTKPVPFRILNVDLVKSVAGGGFYPMEGTLDTFQPDPSRPFTPLTADDYFAGKDLHLQFIVTESMKWSVANIIADQELPKESLLFTFPSGTYYYDGVKGRTMIMGMTEAEYDKLLTPQKYTGPKKGPSKYPRPKNNVSHVAVTGRSFPLTLCLSIVTILLVLAMFWRLRRRKK